MHKLCEYLNGTDSTTIKLSVRALNFLLCMLNNKAEFHFYIRVQVNEVMEGCGLNVGELKLSIQIITRLIFQPIACQLHYNLERDFLVSS